MMFLDFFLSQTTVLERKLSELLNTVLWGSQWELTFKHTMIQNSTWDVLHLLSFIWNYFSILKGILHKFLWFYYFHSNLLIKLCFVAVRIKTYTRVDVGACGLLLWSILSSANRHWQVKFLLLSQPTVPP